MSVAKMKLNLKKRPRYIELTDEVEPDNCKNNPNQRNVKTTVGDIVHAEIGDAGDAAGRTHKDHRLPTPQPTPKPILPRIAEQFGTSSSNLVVGERRILSTPTSAILQKFGVVDMIEELDTERFTTLVVRNNENNGFNYFRFKVFGRLRTQLRQEGVQRGECVIVRFTLNGTPPRRYKKLLYVGLTNAKECPNCLTHIKTVHELSHTCGVDIDRSVLNITGAELVEGYIKSYEDSDGIVLCFTFKRNTDTAAMPITGTGTGTSNSGSGKTVDRTTMTIKTVVWPSQPIYKDVLKMTLNSLYTVKGFFLDEKKEEEDEEEGEGEETTQRDQSKFAKVYLIDLEVAQKSNANVNADVVE